MHWKNLGIIIQERKKPLDCQGAYDEFSKMSGPPGFADGVGDPNLVLDPTEQFLYIYYGTYRGIPTEEGLSVARMNWSDRVQPSGKVFKYYNGDFSEPALGGASTPIFPATIPQEDPNASMYWGPSIHWNTFLNQWVMVLNHSGDAMFFNHDGSYYVSYNADINNVMGWTQPVKFGPTTVNWYPLIIGLEVGVGTDKVAGHIGRFFNGIGSNSFVSFNYPGPSGDARSAGYLPGRLTLKVGELNYIDGFQLILQGDGNLVIYDNNGQPVWDSHTSTHNCNPISCTASFQGDGNLVLYDNGEPYWTTATANKGATALIFQGTQPFLEVLSEETVLWKSDTTN